MKILVITNNIIVSEYLAEILIKEKHTVEQAKTGDDGFQLLEQISFNLVLLDLNLPDMKGLEILKHIRQKQNSLELPVIILCASKKCDTMLHESELKANDFLTDFFDELSLLTKVRNLLQLQQLNEQSNANSLKLKQSEKQLNAIFAFAPTVMLVADAGARIMRINKSAEIFLNQTQEQVYGKLAGDVI
ncbi:MAG: response regulator, partial [Bacteroidales bacterium]|nr:response regulator [Bacteroidales bacterium]